MRYTLVDLTTEDLVVDMARGWGAESLDQTSQMSLEIFTPSASANGHEHGCACSGCNDANIDNSVSSPVANTPVFGLDPADDTIGDTAATASTIALGTAVNGEIQSGGDQDWYAVDLVAGTSYTFFLVGVTQDTAITDAFLRLIGPNGTTEVANGDDIFSTEGDKLSLDSRLIYTPTESGTFYLSAQGFDNSGQPGGAFGEGNYMLTAAQSDQAILGTVDQLAFFLTNQFWGGERSWANGQIDFYYGNLSAEMQNLFDSAFQLWSDVANITFNEVATAAEAQMTFTTDDDGAYSSSSVTNGVITSNVINISQEDWIDRFGSDLTSQTYATVIHEIGHSIGLGHQGYYNGSATYDVDNLFSNDAENWSIMSYFSAFTAGTGGGVALGVTPLLADVLGVQNLYGVNTTTRTGDDTYGFNTTLGGTAFDFRTHANQQVPILTIYDAGGIDTLDASGYSQAQTINLSIDGFSSLGTGVNNVSIARGTIIENAIGGRGRDTIIGNDASNVLTGGRANDILDGGAGIDYANYESGTFEDLTITDNADGSVTVAGGIAVGTDTLTNIEFIRINGQDYAIGSEDPGPDWTANADTGDGTAGDDTIDGLAGNDTINGLAGNDTLYGSEGNDTLNGGDGNDTLTGGVGADTLNGGLGVDIADYSTATSGVLVDFVSPSANTGDASGDVFIDIENLSGSDFNDSLRGTSSAETIMGLMGNDAITGRAGDDVLFGGGGNDTLFGNTGNDRLEGGDGDDLIIGGEGADLVYGGAGNDTADYRSSSIGLVIDMNNASVNTGDAAGDEFNQIENLTGSNFNDSLRGKSGNETITGRDGDDAITGRGGDDVLLGGGGNDTLLGNTGDDRLEGGDGDDLLVGGEGADLVYGGAGNDTADYRSSSIGLIIDMVNASVNTGDAAGDIFNQIENLTGSDFNDTLSGKSAGETLTGRTGDDFIDGRQGSDTLIGGGGNDTLTGGTGTDTFVFESNWGSDIITDFDTNGELIDMRALGITLSDLSVTASGSNTLITYGANTIMLEGVDSNTIDASDFGF